MATLYVTSTEAFTGKSLVAMALATKFKESGLRVGYFKPVGLAPTKVGRVVTDEDAVFIRQQLYLEDSAANICPVAITPDLLRQVYEGAELNLRQRLLDAFQAIGDGRDVVVAAGAGSVRSTGAALGLTGPAVCEMLDAKAVLVGKFESDLTIDALIASIDILGDRLIGLIINDVQRGHLHHIQTAVQPYLERRGVRVLGIMPRDTILRSVSVAELAETLHAKVLSGQDHLDEFVEHFSVGAMNVESALRHFRRTSNKAVITGGDRSDIQLVALETSTKCIVLTGDLYPNSLILARAEELDVPMLIVPDDTLATVERIERLLGRSRVREPRKIERAIGLVEEHVDVAAILAALRLSAKK